MKTCLDTNVLVYMLDRSDEYKHSRALAVLEDVLRNPHTYAIVAQVVAEFLYVVKRKQPRALGDALLLVERLRDKGVILGSYGVEEAVRAAAHPARRFWDALIAYTCLSHGIGRIMTENTGDFTGLLEAVNPF